jgi:hypothetical protein
MVSLWMVSLMSHANKQDATPGAPIRRSVYVKKESWQERRAAYIRAKRAALSADKRKQRSARTAFPAEP